MSYRIIILIVLLVKTTYLFAQTDSITVNTQKPTFLKNQVLPLSLMASGCLLNIGDIKQTIQDQIPRTQTTVDDYFEYSTMPLLYFYDILGFKHKSSVFDQTKYLLISQITSAVIVHTLKEITNVERPSHIDNSFPSGHVCNAFVGATIIYYEFRDSAPLVAYSGYAIGIATGILRLTNNAHWLPDVLFSAGLGMLTVNLVYHFEPLKNWQPFKKNKNLSFTPVLGTNSAGFICRF